RLDAELAAEVGEEGAVGDLAQLDAIDGAELLDDLHRMVVAAGQHGDVGAHPFGTGGGDVEGGDGRNVLLDPAGDVADGRRARRELESDRDGVAHGRHR